jgi:GNAT superfamily N-acetyltransferase
MAKLPLIPPRVKPKMMPKAVQIRRLNLQDSKEAQDLLTLQLAAYEVEARIIGFEEIPPLQDTLETLQACDEIFFGCFLDGVLVGAVSYKVKQETLDIYRMMVHPAYFRHGIASTLLHFAQDSVPEARRIIVSTGTKNLPACQLYLRHGFTQLRQEEVEPGLFITDFEKLRHSKSY